MCGFIIRIMLGALAVLLAAVGLIILTFRIPLLNSYTYEQSFKEIELYSYIADEITTNLLPDRTDPKTKGAYIFIDPILDNLDLEKQLQLTTETNLQRIFGWLNGNTEELFLYFPRQNLIDSFSYDDIEANLIQEFQTYIRELPTCTPEEEKEQFKNNSNEIVIPTCKPEGDYEEFINATEAEALKELQKIFKGKNPIANALNQSEFKNLNENTPLNEILKNQSEPQRQTTLTTLNKVRDVLFYSFVVSIVLIILSMLLSIIIIVTGKLTKRSTVSTLSTLIIFTGIIVASFGLLGRFLPEFIISRLVESGSLETENQLVNIGQLSIRLIRDLIPRLFEVSFISGIALFIFGLGVKLTSLFISNPKKDKIKKQEVQPQPGEIVLTEKPKVI